jgi:hypothetical protein
MTETTVLYQKPAYSEELFQSLYPMVCKMINETVMKVPFDSDHTDRHEDYVQRCRYWTWQHCELYDPNRTGANGKTSKFSTYMQMVYYSRLGAIANNLRKKKKKGSCVDFSNFTSSEETYTNNDISYLSEDISIDIDFLTVLNEKVSFLQNKLPPEKFNIYKDYFIEGNKTLGFLTEKYPDMKYNQIKNTITELKSIHERIMGELC